MSNNEVAIYHILKRRGKVAEPFSYDEYAEAAKEVVAGIPPESITPIGVLLTRLEGTILKRRSAWDFSFFQGPKSDGPRSDA
jgi:hypothetical protein